MCRFCEIIVLIIELTFHEYLLYKALIQALYVY